MQLVSIEGVRNERRAKRKCTVVTRKQQKIPRTFNVGNWASLVCAEKTFWTEKGAEVAHGDMQQRHQPWSHGDQNHHIA